MRKKVPESQAEKSEEGAKDTISSIDDIVKALPEKTEAARNLSRNLAMTKKDRDLANDEGNRIKRGFYIFFTMYFNICREIFTMH